jgi:hypothetical protein
MCVSVLLCVEIRLLVVTDEFMTWAYLSVFVVDGFSGCNIEIYLLWKFTGRLAIYILITGLGQHVLVGRLIC